MVTEEQKSALNKLLVALGAVVGAFFEAYSGVADKIVDILTSLFF